MRTDYHAPTSLPYHCDDLAEQRNREMARCPRPFVTEALKDAEKVIGSADLRSGRQGGNMKRSWINIVILGAFCLTIAVPGRGDAGDRCEYPRSRSFVAGRDAQGYFIRAAPLDPRGRGEAQQPITAVGDYLAAEAGATIVFLSSATAKAIDQGEWRGHDPLSALKAFAQAGGLFVATPAPGWWVIEGPCDFDSAAPATISVQCLGSVGQGWADPTDVRELERALVTQLPIRTIPRQGDQSAASLSVQYYWIPEEGPDTLLVLTSQQAGLSSTEYHGFKVHVTREGSKIRVTCIWTLRQNHVPSGRLVPEVAEDFDGDGYRDFVFYAEDEKFVNTIVSGKDGRLLLAFSGAEMAVDRGGRPQVRLALDGTYDMKYGGEKPDREGPELEGPVVLTFDPKAGQFQPSAGSNTAVTAKAIGQAPGGRLNGPRRALAAALGGADKVRVYLLHPGAHYPGGGYEEIPPTQQRNPERILFKYSPPPPASKEPGQH